MRRSQPPLGTSASWPPGSALTVKKRGLFGRVYAQRGSWKDALGAAHTIMSADSGYYSEDNLKQLEAKGIEAFIPDNGYRKRDPRYEGQEHYKAKPDPLWTRATSRQPNHGYFARVISKWPQTSATASARQESGYIATGATATLAGAKR